MQHKFLLRYIKQEMEQSKIAFKNNEAFFRLFVKDEPWESYRSNMSNWLSSSVEDGTIRKHTFINAINEKLGLEPSIWGASTQLQQEAVQKGVVHFEEALNREHNMFSWLDKEGMNSEQEAFLAFVKTATLVQVEKSLPVRFLEKSSKNQSFLITLFNLMYERGEYAFVHKNVFPSLLDSYDNEIRAKKANIYASLPKPMYQEAFEILNAIKGEDDLETMDLKTSAISNIRREHFSSPTLSKEKLNNLLHTFIGCYKKIYVPKQSYSYYPGINLAYIVALVEYMDSDEMALLEGYSVKQIYSDVQKSILKANASDDKSERYYASMSEIEFELLLNRKGMVRELEMLLETLMPTINQVTQTRRQIDTFFMQMVERFSDKVLLNLEEYQNVLEVFDAYISVKKI